MKTPSAILATVIAASSFALALPPAAAAGPMGERGHCDMQSRMEGRHAGGGEHGLRGLLRGLDLSESQRDQIFAIMHAQAPEMRARMKAVHASRDALRDLSLSGEYDAAKARELAGQNAQAVAAMAELRASTGARVFALLTPEQREVVRKRQAEDEGRWGMERMGMHKGFGADWLRS